MTTDVRIYEIWSAEKGRLISNINIIYKYINKSYHKKLYIYIIFDQLMGITVLYS